MMEFADERNKEPIGVWNCANSAPFTELVNSFTPTHHVNRLIPDRLRLKEGQHARIYDLEAFTSRAREQRNFLRSLSKFCSGWEFTYWDSRMGCISCDFGELLGEYAETCSTGTQVSYERVTKEISTSEQRTSGLLGVFGNLPSCTFMHGSVVSFATEDETQINVAGDDGISAEDPDNELELDICICAIGIYERSKTFDTRLPGCICLKRPIAQHGNLLVTRLAIIPPNLNTLLYHIYGIADPRYQYVDMDRNLGVVAKELMRFLRSVYRARHTLSDEEISDAQWYAWQVTKICEMPFGGGVPQCGSKVFWPCAYGRDESMLEDPLIRLLNRHYAGVCQTTKKDSVDSVWIGDHNYVGAEFIGNSDRHLSYLRKLGYLEAEVEMEVLRDEEGYERLLNDYLNPRIASVVYKYKCVREVPVHLIN
jgi:hypothetical protein